jgi:hypothetical protein
MYDFDDKLVAADEKEIRLWDFWDHKEEAPQLLTTMEAPFVIDKVFCFHVCKQNKKSPNYVLITHGGTFQLYQGRLELFFEDKIVGTTLGINPTVESAEYWFGDQQSKMIIGTSDGRLIIYDLETKLKETEVQVEGAHTITKISGFVYIEKVMAFLVLIDKKNLYIFDGSTNKYQLIDFGESGKAYQGKEICNIQVAYNSKFFAVGIPDVGADKKTRRSAFGVFSIDRDDLRVYPPVTWITKVSFNF